MAQEYEPIIDHSEDVEINWRQYLAEFDEMVWPMFKRYGFTKDTAFLAWMLNRVRLEVENLPDQLRDDEEDWRL